MKKILLIFFALFFYPLFTFSQQQVELKSGQKFEGYIQGVWSGDLHFYQKISEIDSKKVDVLLVKSIAGEIDNSVKKNLIKKNPEIFFVESFSPTTTDNSYQVYNQSSKTNITAGDHLVTAGTRYLTGVTLAVVGGTMSVVGATQESDQLSIAGGVIAIVGGIISVTGHFQLIKAGKKMNSDAVTLGPSTNGVGLAINF
jgi:hypothetical protein